MAEKGWLGTGVSTGAALGFGVGFGVGVSGAGQENCVVIVDAVVCRPSGGAAGVVVCACGCIWLEYILPEGAFPSGAVAW